MSEDTTASSEGNSVPLRVYNPIANAVHAAGSLPAALLLLRIAYWTPKTKIVKDGKAWAIKSREEWAAEAGVTFEQVKNAIPELVKRGLVEKTGGVFSGKRALFVRLSVAGQKALAEGITLHPKATAPKSNKVVPFTPKAAPKPDPAEVAEVWAILNEM